MDRNSAWTPRAQVSDPPQRKQGGEGLWADCVEAEPETRIVCN